MRYAAIAVLCLGSTACITPPAQVSIPAGSNQGLILVEVDPAATTFNTPEGQPSALSLGYFLTFSRYPGDSSGSAPAVLGDWVHVDIWKDSPERFYAAPAPAGTYAFEALNVGGGVSWGSCFNQGTVAFDVPAGEIVYLGELAPRPVFEDISANLPSSLQVGEYRYLFDRKAPALGAPDSEQQKTEEITAFLRRVYPRVQGPVRMGTLRPVSFQSGKPSKLNRFPRCAKTH
jgi:hypothetical protein